jgi:hypothetical protein
MAVHFAEMPKLGRNGSQHFVRRVQGSILIQIQSPGSFAKVVIECGAPGRASMSESARAIDRECSDQANARMLTNCARFSSIIGQ